MNFYVSQRPLLSSTDSFVDDAWKNIILIIRRCGGNHAEGLDADSITKT